MANCMNEDEKSFHALFTETHHAYQANRFADAKAGIELLSDALEHGAGIYTIVFYVNALFATTLLGEAIDRSKAKTKEVA